MQAECIAGTDTGGLPSPLYDHAPGKGHACVAQVLQCNSAEPGFRRRKLRITRPPREREVSLAPLRLLSEPNPLRWASIRFLCFGFVWTLPGGGWRP